VPAAALADCRVWQLILRCANMGWTLFRGFTASTLSAILLCQLLCIGDSKVVLKHVYPTGGSFAGGTRMVIRGSGFSSGTGPGNVVTIGGLPCEPVTLHSTVAQIVCKVMPLPPDRAWHDQGGDSGYLPVKVFVGGEESECQETRHQPCSFRFAQWWHHTPRLRGIEPRAVHMPKHPRRKSL